MNAIEPFLMTIKFRIDQLEDKLNIWIQTVLEENNIKQEQIDELYENDFDERISGIENIEIEQRLIKLEKYSYAHEEYLKRIDKIALCNPDKTLANQKFLNEKLAALEQLFYDEKEKFRNQDRKPHKCPVCDGSGFLGDVLLLSLPPTFAECKTCEGKGIIWG